jgi:exodeoxyribonuclease VII small subunit
LTLICDPDRFAKSANAKGSRKPGLPQLEKAASSKPTSILGSKCRGQGRAASGRIVEDDTRVPTKQHARANPADMSETSESPPSFEAALAELEAIVARMESGELPLSESLDAYTRGAELLAYCQAALKDAQQQVQVLERGVLQPFSPPEADDA